MCVSNQQPPVAHAREAKDTKLVIWVLIVVILGVILNREQDIHVWLLHWGLLPNAVYLLVRKGPIDHSQTMTTDMELAGMGCCIGIAPLIEGLAGLHARPGQRIVGKTQLRLLPGT